MAKLRLFKQYTIWLPSLWGCLLILFLLSFTGFFAFKHLGFFLAYQHPVESDILVIDGWLTEEGLHTAAEHIKQNDYSLLITSGGPITQKLVNPLHDNYAEQATFVLTQYDISSDKIVTVPTPASAQNRTYLSAVSVRDWLANSKRDYKSITLFTGGVHSRRSHMLYKMAFDDDKKIGVILAAPNGYELNQWWTSSRGVKAVLGETISLIWTACCFYPGEKGSHQEKWGVY